MTTYSLSDHYASQTPDQGLWTSVFKTGEGSIRPLAGSIPVRLRHTWDSADDSNISDLCTTSDIEQRVSPATLRIVTSLTDPDDGTELLRSPQVSAHSLPMETI